MGNVLYWRELKKSLQTVVYIVFHHYNSLVLHALEPTIKSNEWEHSYRKEVDHLEFELWQVFAIYSRDEVIGKDCVPQLKGFVNVKLSTENQSDPTQ